MAAMVSSVMDSQQYRSSWGACLISAFAGSAMTLLTIELHRRSKLSVPSLTHAPEDDANKTLDESDEVSKATAAKQNIKDPLREREDHREKVTICDVCQQNIFNSKADFKMAEDLNYRPTRKSWKHPMQRTSFSGSFSGVDGLNRISNASINSSNSGSFILPDFEQIEEMHENRYASEGTRIHVLSEESGLLDEKSVREHQEFDARVVSKLRTLDESKLLLHRTRAVSSLASCLMAAPDEEACYDIASRLLVPLFHVDRCSYALKKDSDHIIVKGVTVQQRQHATKLGLEGVNKGGVVKPIKDTMIGVCATTLEQQYCPRSKDSIFETQRMMHSAGINSILATPILVNGNKFAGAIVVSMKEEDAFREYDRILIQDIACMLGANIYAKRMRKAAEHSNKVSREMLHSMIPSKVIEKIEVFWDENTDEYMSRRTSLVESRRGAPVYDSISDDITKESLTPRKNPGERSDRCQAVSNKINFLNTMNNLGDDDSSDDACVIVDMSAMEVDTVSRALYAENVQNVSIIFTDVVGFSKMALDMKPLEIVDMLQSLFGRFDSLCYKHGVTKLETIGDAYIATTNLFDEEQFCGNVAQAAWAALSFAKDMVLATQDGLFPYTLQIRVGIHIGEVTCGVLGERLPKFTVFGHNVNLAARMEQTSKPNMIRVTEDFRRLVSNKDDEWDKYEMVSMKNMGEVGTYILDPSKPRIGCSF